MTALICLINKVPRHGLFFVPEDVGNLQMALQSAAIAIEACKVFDDQKRYCSRMNDFVALAQLDAAQISLSLLTDRVVALIGCARGAIFCVDSTMGKQELFFMVDSANGGPKREIRIPLTSKSIAGACILDNEIINIADCYRDPRFNSNIDKSSGFKTTQMLCMPIVSQGKTIGAIQVINSQNGMSFDDQDCKILSYVCPYVQVAVENKRNQGRTESVKMHIAESVCIGSHLSMTSSIEELVAVLFSRVSDYIQCDYIACFFPAGDGALCYDNKELAPHQVHLSSGSMVHASMNSKLFWNMMFPTSKLKEGKLVDVEDVYYGDDGQRQWAKVMTALPEEPCLQGRAADVHCKAGEDFVQEYLLDAKWTNMLVVPVENKCGTMVLQVAGKRACVGRQFTVVDEEILALVGQQCASMLHLLLLSTSSS